MQLAFRTTTSRQVLKVAHVQSGQLLAPTCHCKRLLRAAPRAGEPKALDVGKLSELMALQPMTHEQQFNMDRLVDVLGEPVGVVKNMVFKKRGLLSLQPDEVKVKIELLADVVEVPYDKARRMAVIQPGLFFETEKQAQVLKAGIRSIAYELNMPKDEVVDLILENQSVLHGRQLHLSAADMAHLAIVREPKGRIVE